VNVCVCAYIGLNLMLDTQLVYEITNETYIQLSVTHSGLLVATSSAELKVVARIHAQGACCL